MTDFDPTAIIDAGGWDMVIGIPLEVINQALVAEALDLAFSYSASSGGQTIALNGTFGPWSIVSGAGQDLTLSIPVEYGTAVVAGAATNPFDVPEGSYSLDGMTVTVRTRLQFEVGPTQSQPTKLLFAFDDSSATPSASTDMPEGGILSGGSALPPLLQQMLPAMIASCLAANIDKANLVFATLTANTGLPGELGGSGQGSWQYALASQQNSDQVSLAIFYSTGTAPTSSPTIPASIGPQNDQCIVVLSQPMALSTVVLPAILYGLNHASAPMPALFGVGPIELSPPPASNTITASQFSIQPGPAGSNSAEIAATSPIALNLGGYSFGATATLTNFECTLSGESLTVAFDAQTSADPSFSSSSSNVYQFEIGQQWIYGQRAFGISLSHSPGSTGTTWSGAQRMIFGAIERGMTCNPLPFTFHLFTNQMLQVEDGYLNGGLGIAGNIVSL